MKHILFIFLVIIALFVFNQKINSSSIMNKEIIARDNIVGSFYIVFAIFPLTNLIGFTHYFPYGCDTWDYKKFSFGMLNVFTHPLIYSIYIIGINGFIETISGTIVGFSLLGYGINLSKNDFIIAGISVISVSYSITYLFNLIFAIINRVYHYSWRIKNESDNIAFIIDFNLNKIITAISIKI